MKYEEKIYSIVQGGSRHRGHARSRESERNSWTVRGTPQHAEPMEKGSP